MPLDALVSGRIATLAGQAGFGWVEAIGIKDGRVAFAGSAVDLESRADPHTRRYELEPGEIAIPGLVDAHVHLVGAALAGQQVDLKAAKTLDEALAGIRAAAEALPDGAWLQGAGWDARRWGRFPTAADLESVAPGRFAAFWSVDHHALWVSRAALAVGGIPSEDPDGGIVERDTEGSPTGILREAATRLVSTQIPPPNEATLERAIAELARSFLGFGVVGIHDPGALIPTGEPWLQRLLVRMAERDDLPIRIHAGIRADALEASIAAGLRSGARLTDADAPDRVRMGWLKLFADGTLGSGTAALLEPRASDAGGGRGMFTTPPEELASLASRAGESGIATAIHAIGDAAVRAALDALAPTSAAVPLMPRVEHVQLCDPLDRPRFAAAGIAASVQPVHLRDDAATARRDWGDRAEPNGYAWRSLLEAGATLAFGTDAPVEPIDPWPGIAMAVMRRWPGWPATEPAFGPDEALTLEQALRASTIGPAAVAREPDRGRLVPGAPADVIVLPAAPREGARTDDGLEGSGGFATPFAEVRPRVVLVDGEPMIER